MNIGNLPGYYFDPATRKYFKITATHHAPPNVPYSAANVAQDERERKRRKTELIALKKRSKQTVTPASLLKDPLLGGAGLLREQGSQPHASGAVARDAAFVHALECTASRVILPGTHDRFGVRVVAAHAVPASRRSVVAVHHSNQSSHVNGSYVIYLYEHNQFGLPWLGTTQASALHASFERLIGLSLMASDDADFVVSCSNNGSGPATVYYSKLPHRPHDGPADVESSVWTLGWTQGGIWDFKLNVNTGIFAIAGSKVLVSTLDLAHSSTVPNFHTLQEGEEAFTVDWLDPRTVAFGVRGHERKHAKTHHLVHLWDLRSQDSSTRIQRPMRITGIQAPDDTGHNLLVSSARNVGLYDLRFMRSDCPVLSIDHESPRVPMTFSAHNGILAAVDSQNVVQTYSLRTGRKIRSLHTASNSLKSDIHWYDDDGKGRSCLQVCSEDKLITWV